MIYLVSYLCVKKPAKLFCHTILQAMPKPKTQHFYKDGSLLCL